jgi:hypothetical protein
MKLDAETTQRANEDTFDRVRKQINNLGSVNKTEAFVTCLAYTRCLAQIMAQISDSDGEYISKLDELQGLMLIEGTTVRRTLGLPS